MCYSINREVIKTEHTFDLVPFISRNPGINQNVNHDNAESRAIIMQMSHHHPVLILHIFKIL